jgi:5'-3' exonuclease
MLLVMDVYLLDGTYELFRHHFGVPSHLTKSGFEVAATRGVVGSVIGMLESGVTHIGVATDHVIESFRNDLWPGYKTSAGVDPLLLQQFPLLEEALTALGVRLWPMVELEADDAMGAAARVAASDERVDRIYICSPDKDLAQCVRNDRVLLMDRRNRVVTDEPGVVAKFGVLPESIPDYLALVGDSADGYPGLPGWGAKSAAAVLARYLHFEAIPAAASAWDFALRGADKLARVLVEQREYAMLFRDLATLRSDAAVLDSVDELSWRGPQSSFEAVSDFLEAPQLYDRAVLLAETRG